MDQKVRRWAGETPAIRRVYIACCLTHVPRAVFDEHCSTIRDIADLLENAFGLEVKHALRDSDPRLPEYAPRDRPAKCYEWDRKMVEDADLVIAETSFPSTGTGMEIQIAEYNEIPVVLLYRNRGMNLAEEKTYRTSDNCEHTLQIGNRVVSIMVQGNPAVRSEIAYSDRTEALESIRKLMKDLLDHTGER